MPAEWEPHEGTWLGWPHEVTDWPGKFAAIPWAFAEIVRHLSQVERVYLLVEDRAVAEPRQILLKVPRESENVDFMRVPTDRGWMRDSGPICVKMRRQSRLQSLRIQRLGKIFPITRGTRKPL